MIQARQLIALWHAAVHNEPQEWSEATPLQPRTEAGLLAVLSGGIGVYAVSTAFSLTSIAGLLVSGIPGVVLLIGLILVVVPPW